MQSYQKKQTNRRFQLLLDTLSKSTPLSNKGVPGRRVNEVILGFNKQQLKISTRDRMSTDRVAVGVGIQVDEINT